MSDFALFLTWTCYGTWPPGDERGYVSNTRSKAGGFENRHNGLGTPYTSDDSDSRELARENQLYETVRLTRQQAEIVAQALLDASAEQAWMIRRAAIMANHVHVVVMDCPDDGPGVRRILKGVTQAKLSNFVGENRRWWTQNGSDHYLHGTNAIEATIRYTAKQEFWLVQIANGLIIRRDDADPDGGDKPRRSPGERRD